MLDDRSFRCGIECCPKICTLCLTSCMCMCMWYMLVGMLTFVGPCGGLSLTLCVFLNCSPPYYFDKCPSLKSSHHCIFIHQVDKKPCVDIIYFLHEFITCMLGCAHYFCTCWVSICTEDLLLSFLIQLCMTSLVDEFLAGSMLLGLHFLQSVSFHWGFLSIHI